MRKMKKALAVMLAATMTLSMGMTALAEPGDGMEGKKSQYEIMNASATTNTIQIKKLYTITHDEAENDEDNNIKPPVDTFKFELITEDDNFKPQVTGNSAVTTAPTEGLRIEDIIVDPDIKDTHTYTTTVHLPSYTAVGVYTYYFEEKAYMDSALSNNAGVECFSGKVKLVVTITQEGEEKKLTAAVRMETFDESGEVSTSTKTDTLENVYNAGIVTLKKNVTGSMGDTSKFFEFHVTFTAPQGKTLGADITTNGSEIPKDDNNGKNVAKAELNADKTQATAIVYIRNGSTLKFYNVPYGVTYTIDEIDYVTSDQYDVPTATLDGENAQASLTTVDDQKYYRVNGTMNDALDAIEVTNNKELANIDTGIVLDNAPYILLLVLAALGMFGFVSKKRSMEF